MVIEDLSDAVDSQVGWGMARKDLAIVGIMSLSHEHGGDAVPPNAFDRGQDVQFVVEHYVMLGWVPRSHIGEFLLFVHIDEDSPLNGFGQAGFLDFARLEHHIPVAEQSCFPPALDMT
jgi:hypothetical protein